MATTTDLDLIRIHGQCHEIMKRIANGSLNERNVRKALQDIIEGKFSEDARFDRYASKLVSAFDWLTVLRRYNTQYWDNRFTEEDFAAGEAQLSEIGDDHTQSVRGLFGFHVVFGTPAETIEMWMKVFKGELPNAELWETLQFDDEHFRLSDLAETYEPGIHLVWVNLAAHWEPKDGRTIDEVRPQAREAGERLAQLELLSIWGVLIDLFQCQNGTDLPFTDMAGTEVTVPGHPGSEASDAWRGVLYVIWLPGRRRARVGADWAGYRDRRWSAPVVRKV